MVAIRVASCVLAALSAISAAASECPPGLDTEMEPQGAAVAVVSRELKNGADPNCITFTGMTVIEIVYMYEDLPSFKALIDAGADPGRTSRAGSTVYGAVEVDWLMSNRDFGRYAILQGKHPIRLAGDSITPPLLTVLKADDPELTRKFLSRADKLDINAKDGIGMTAVGVMAKEGSKPNLEAMLSASKGIDVSVRDRLGRGAVEFAVERGDPEILKVLLTGVDGWDLNHADMLGRTPLHAAAEAGNARLVEVLLQYGKGIYPQHRDMMGKTPADLGTPEVKAAIERHVK